MPTTTPERARTPFGRTHCGSRRVCLKRFVQRPRGFGNVTDDLLMRGFCFEQKMPSVLSDALKEDHLGYNIVTWCKDLRMLFRMRVCFKTVTN